MLVRPAALTAALAIAAAAGAEPARTVLPQYDVAALQQPEVAQAAVTDVARETEALREQSAAARLACYRRFAVNACLSRVEAARREDEQRLQWIRAEANRVLRQQRAIRLNERLAEAAAQQRGTAGPVR
jgi:colicin import membrane protein